MSSGQKYFTVKAGGTYLSNHVIKNEDVTVDALGLLVIMLAMHPAAPKTRDTLIGRGMGRRRVADALACLERAGFRHRFRYQDTERRWRSITVLFDAPVDASTGFNHARSLVKEDEIVCWANLTAQNDDGCDIQQDSRAGDEAGGVGRVRAGNTSPASSTGHPVENSNTVDVSPVHTEVPLPVPREETTESEPVDNFISDEKTCLDVRAGHGSENSVFPVDTEVPVTDRRQAVRSISNDIVNKPKGLPSNHPSTATGSLRSVDGGNGSDVDWDLIREWIPSSLISFLPAGAGRKIMTIIHHAQTDGWSASYVKRILGSQPWPPEARNAPGLVIYRLNDVLAGTRPLSREEQLSAKQQMLADAEKDLQAIIDGTSELTAREQWIRVNSLADKPDVIRVLNDLLYEATWAVERLRDDESGLFEEKRQSAKMAGSG
ncbi:hypothetical protein [Arcanobacterium bovis]|uniref:Uncharacterized protein n=1 Tax=Arcanobacterium bovis TaxID=2529275 RepID=A0A4Q9V2L3_9ACTO|nr:hypothetical protein [Arcanobacterium bovis]TBW23905.1 hypothetical protein EZJ44_01935 [Arcanobacterium bovis]